MTTRWADTVEDRPRWRINLAKRITSRLMLGVEHNPVVREFVPIANWIITTESSRSPMLNLGTSSDRIGSREGTHAYYLTAAKGIPALRAAPYVSINYSETDRRMNFPFGMNIALTDRLDLLPMNDGRRSHLLLTYKGRNWNVTLISVFLRRTGISVGMAF